MNLPSQKEELMLKLRNLALQWCISVKYEGKLLSWMQTRGSSLEVSVTF